VTSPQLYRRIMALLVWALALTILEYRRVRKSEDALDALYDDPQFQEDIHDHQEWLRTEEGQAFQKRHVEQEIDYQIDKVLRSTQ